MVYCVKVLTCKKMVTLEKFLVQYLFKCFFIDHIVGVKHC